MRVVTDHKMIRLPLLNNLGITVALALAVFAQSSLAAEKAWDRYMSDGEESVTHGDLGKAEIAFRHAIEQAKKAPHASEQLAECQNKLANTLALEGRTDEAEAIYQRSLSQLERDYGKDSEKVAPTLLALGSFFEAEGDHRSAMALYEKAVNINERSFSQFSPAIADVVHNPTIHIGSIGATPYGTASAAMPQQAGLGASAQLLKSVVPLKDLVKREDNSNQDLIRDFQNQFKNPERQTATVSSRTAARESMSRSNTD
jgi:tetratricopeptide (TPR) repeat protein